MSDVLKEYFDALERLKKNKPIVVAVGTKITKDSVALEAGRSKGAIKKSRLIYADLIAAIDSAQESKGGSIDQYTILDLQNQVEVLNKSLEKAYGRELSLLYENYALKKEIKELSKLKLIPIN